MGLPPFISRDGRLRQPPAASSAGTHSRISRSRAPGQSAARRPAGAASSCRDSDSLDQIFLRQGDQPVAVDNALALQAFPLSHFDFDDVAPDLGRDWGGDDEASNFVSFTPREQDLSGSLKQLTRDQSLVQMLVDQGLMKPSTTG